MATSKPPLIWYFCLRTSLPDPISTALSPIPATVRVLDLNEPLPDEPCDLLIFCGEDDPERAALLCQQVRNRTATSQLPILWLAGSPAERQQGLEAGADAALQRPNAPGELLAQAKALLRIKLALDKLREESAEFHRVNKRLQLAYQQIDQELELACRIQQSMLPQRLPEMPTVKFAVHYRPCNRVGGDFYDLFRLDEHHLGFYIADVMGHGVPASLLTIFLKKAVVPKEISGRSYRLLQPQEVLARLNRDFIDQNLAETPFITIIYALLNVSEQTIQFARAGHPYPLHIPKRGPVTAWQEHGTLLGVFDTIFPTRTEKLTSGDKLLLYTDGLEAPSLEPQSSEEILRPCVEKHRHLPVQEMVSRVAEELFRDRSQPDDFTMLGMELTSEK